MPTSLLRNSRSVGGRSSATPGKPLRSWKRKAGTRVCPSVAPSMPCSFIQSSWVQQRLLPCPTQLLSTLELVFWGVSRSLWGWMFGDSLWASSPPVKGLVNTQVSNQELRTVYRLQISRKRPFLTNTSTPSPPTAPRKAEKSNSLKRHKRESKSLRIQRQISSPS